MASDDDASGGTTDVEGADAGRLDTMVAGDTVTIVDHPERELRRGDSVGRYTILEELGAGGMGIVYAAYDPQLDRKVAVKLLHKRGRAGGMARLLREAQAMAKLSHPNVVAVLDVGTRDDQVFVAMEYVQGTTLTAWLVSPRTWREVLAVYLAAGRGLAAAHHAGLLHRDVKPDNVLVGDDGRVRVADFGLARAADDSAISLTSSVTDTGGDTPAISVLGADLTQTGSMLGTPAYMAPEQYRGEGGAAADQFSFCVALYEGLYGERPFAGATLEELLASIKAARVREAPSGSGVPPWLRRVIVRGLAADGAARWSSMEALLVELERDPTRRRRRAIAALAAVAVIGGGAAAFAMRGGAKASACGSAADGLAGVWSAPRKALVHAAFDRSGVPYAPAAWSTVERTLDGYAQSWAKMRIEACSATERGEESAPLRASCLDRRLEGLREQVKLFVGADAHVVEHAVVSAQRVAPLATCADERALAATGLGDARARAAADPLWKLLDEAGPLLQAGRLAEARTMAETAATEGHRLGLARVEDEAQIMLGQILLSLGDAKGAEDSFFAAARAAQVGADDVRAAAAWRDLTFVVGYMGQRHAEGHRYAELAAATIDRIGGDESLRADLDDALGTLEWAEGDYAASRRDHTAALDARERLRGPDDLDVAASLANLAVVEKDDGHYQLAADFDKRAIDILVTELGPDHPQLAGAYSNLGNVYSAQGDDAHALDWHKRALAVAERAIGADTPDVAFYLTNVGASLSNLGRDDEAMPLYERALAIQERTLGDHPDVALTIANIAVIDEARGRLVEAEAGYARALAIDEKALGPDHPTVADNLDELGNVLHLLHRDDEALARHRRALAIGEKVGPTNPPIATSLIGIGNALVALHRAGEAIAPLERAVSMREAGGGDPVELADARYSLAEALGAAGRDPARAVELAKKALAAYTAAGRAAADHRKDAEAWLAKHAPR